MVNMTYTDRMTYVSYSIGTTSNAVNLFYANIFLHITDMFQVQVSDAEQDIRRKLLSNLHISHMMHQFGLYLSNKGQSI